MSGTLILEGKAKKVFQSEVPDEVIIEFKNSATAFNNLKKAEFADKGRTNCAITSALFKKLAEFGIKSHFVKQIDDTHMQTKKLTMIPLEVVVRNFAAGSLVKRLGFTKGHKLQPPIVEFYLKNDALGDPILSEDHIFALKLVTPEELKELREKGLKLNSALQEIFRGCGVDLADFKVEYGRYHGEILLADEITPDTCRFWDQKSGTSLDKDIFRNDQGNLMEGYHELLRRMQAGGLQ